MAFGYSKYFPKKDDLKIKGYTGTAAEEYAKANGFEFVSLGETEKPPVSSETGDVNLDGSVTSEDALLVLQAVTGLANLTDEQKAVADLDGDSEITSSDALKILQIVVGIA